MGPPLVYKVDLTELQGEGDFPCPGCGVIISPEDETEDVYIIVNTKVNGDELEELVINVTAVKAKSDWSGLLFPKCRGALFSLEN